MKKVNIIGAGIVGISTACFLSQQGYEITIFDPVPPEEWGASKGNASIIIPSLIEPTASMDVIKNLPKLLFDPFSPLVLPLKNIPFLTPWLVQFAKACLPSQYNKGVSSIAHINSKSLKAWNTLLSMSGNEQLMRPLGALFLYEDKKNFVKDCEKWARINQIFQRSYEIIDAKKIAQLEPAIKIPFVGGIKSPDTQVLNDPANVLTELANYAQSQGVTIKRDKVIDVDLENNQLHLLSSQKSEFDQLVVAAGAWSSEITQLVGEPQNLIAERGYNLTITEQTPINHALFFLEKGVVMTPLDGATRFGGLDELGNIDRHINPNIHAKIKSMAKRFLPTSDWDSAVEWMGHRPSRPNSVPIIAQSKKHSQVFYGFGHGHLGMTQGPITGKTLADLISANKTEINLKHFLSNP